MVCYNLLSTIASGRLEEIIDILGRARANIIVLNGTRHRARSDDEYYSVIHIGKFAIFRWGYLPGGNSHTGIDICIDTTVYPLRFIASASIIKSRSIRGRVGAVRIKTHCCDFTVIGAYFPLCYNENSNKTQQKTLE